MNHPPISRSLTLAHELFLQAGATLRYALFMIISKAVSYVLVAISSSAQDANYVCFTRIILSRGVRVAKQFGEISRFFAGPAT